MTERDALVLMRQILDAHGLRSWRGVIDRAKVRIGQCRYGPREIGLSRAHLNRTDEAIAQTIKHEVAHALVGPGHGHGHVWRAACRITGARPERCSEVAAEAPARWTLRCKACGKTVARHKLTARYKMAIRAGALWHAPCGKAGVLEILDSGNQVFGGGQ